MPSATTAQLFSRSRASASGLRITLFSPLSSDCRAITAWAIGTPMLRSTVESVKSRWRRETGSFEARCSKTALAMPKLPSAFSKSMGLTLWGMALDPTSPALICCLKYSIEM